MYDFCVDRGFLRALASISQANYPLCIFRDNNEIVLCSELVEVYKTIEDVSCGFVVGYQHANGLSGRWFRFASIKRISSPLDDVEQLETDSSTISNKWNSSMRQDEYIEVVSSMITDMNEGQYFLSNLTYELNSNEPIDMYCTAIWSCLFHNSPFRFFLSSSDTKILGLSPERFMRISNGIIESEPMKGTAKDKETLVDNEKEFDENTMIIDLVRSDLSKICDPNTISLEQRDVLSIHPGLVQLSNKIRGELLPDLSIQNAITSMMPIASVTGTPKPYVLKKISQYENYEREVYCGTYGWVDVDNKTCDLAVAIRTIENTNATTKIGVGAGITISSDPQSEYDETVLKSSRLVSLAQRSFAQNIEGVFTSTQIDSNGNMLNQQEHIDRLINDSRRCGIKIDQKYLQETIETFLKTNPVKDKKIRIDISNNGTINPSIDDLPPIEMELLTLSIVPFPQLNKNTSVKIANRNIYDDALKSARLIHGSTIDDTLLLVNGHLTETTRSNFFLAVNNKIVTPPLKDGMLEGITRSKIIDRLSHSGIKVNVRYVTLEDIENSNELIVCNSLRAIQRVGKIDSYFLDKTKIYDQKKNKLFLLAAS